MSNIKTLYTFEAFVEKEVDKIETVTENGQTYDKKYKVKEKVPVKFALKKPSRREFEEARSHYGIEYNKAITDGYLTKGMLVNKYANTTGGVFSENEARDLFALYKKQDLLKVELQQAAAISAPKEIQDDLMIKLSAISRQMFEIENSNNALFQHTAENRAEERTITYMLYFFTYIDKGGKWVPYFEGQDEDTQKMFKMKEEFYFNLEDKEDPLTLSIRDRLLNLYVFYYRGLAETVADFEKAEAELKKRFQAPAVKTETPEPAKA